VNGVSGTAGTGGSQSLTVDGTGASTVSGAISNGTGGGTLSLTKNGTGTLTLSGANSFSGGTTLNAGVLLVQGSSTVSAGSITAGPLGTGSLTLNGGTLGFATGGSYNVANNVSVSGAAKIQVASGTNEVLSGNWSGSASLTLVANGTTGQWQFAGDNSGYTGTFTQNGGNTSLAFNNAAAGSAAAAWNFNNGTNQRTRLNFGNGTINFGSLAGNGSIANVAGSGLSTMSVGALNTNTTFTGLIGGTPLNNQPQGQNIALVKVGTGSLTLTAANPYTSTTTIENGALIAGGNVTSGAASPLGNASSAVALGDAATISSSTAMHPQLLVGGAFTLARAITVGADNSALGNSATNFTLGGSTANTSTVSGPITLNQDLSVTQVSGGTLNLTSNITSGASGTQTITFDNAGAVSQSVGTIGGGTGTIALKKINSGTLTLAGANSYSGTTTIQSGTLALTSGSSNNIASSTKILVGDTQANSAANLDVTGLSGGGITLASNQTLAGYGTVSGNVAGVSASTVAPGDVAANGVLKVAGNFALGSGTFDVQLNKTAADAAGGAQVAGTDFDQLVVSGSGSTVSVSGGNLALTLGNNLVNGDVFTILDNQGSSAIDGIFSGATVNGMAATGSFTNGGTFSADVGGTNYSFLIRYDAGTGNDVALTVAVPEPGALAVMCGLGIAGLMRRRRRLAESV
ncbi:MAG: autotransporter-associated beta strand repeat-containing protein, partial [Tepidisphaeraceae bacterium]